MTNELQSNRFYNALFSSEELDILETALLRYHSESKLDPYSKRKVITRQLGNEVIKARHARRGDLHGCPKDRRDFENGFRSEMDER